MESKEHLILINGQDKTDSVASFRFQDGMCEVVFAGSPKVYRYHSDKVQVLAVQRRIDPAELVVVVRGEAFSQIEEILDFGPYYRLQYERCKTVRETTVLSCYLNRDKKPVECTPPETIIYPFGLNQSQKTAVENALSAQVSIIQGPPGTGKTQTILNIIANVVRASQTVAVVSNNNSATLNVAEKLEKKGLGFLTAFLGSQTNKEHFLEGQTGQYPDMGAWELEPEEQAALDQQVTALSKELSEMLNAKNRIAAIEQELLELRPEQHYFGEYYATYGRKCPWSR